MGVRIARRDIRLVEFQRTVNQQPRNVVVLPELDQQIGRGVSPGRLDGLLRCLLGREQAQLWNPRSRSLRAWSRSAAAEAIQSWLRSIEKAAR